VTLTISRAKFEAKKAELEQKFHITIPGDSGTVQMEHLTVTFSYKEPVLTLETAHHDSSPHMGLFPTFDHGLRGFFTE
jgi:hypothetical protein